MAEFVDNWQPLAKCREGVDPDFMFAPKAKQESAKLVCLGCVVRYECLAFALDEDIGYGVWGGTTENERKRLLKQHPGIEDWPRVVKTAADLREATQVSFAGKWRGSLAGFVGSVATIMHPRFARIPAQGSTPSDDELPLAG